MTLARVKCGDARYAQQSLSDTAYEGIRRRIRSYRERAGLTQDQLGHDVGVDPKLVWRWEAGQRRPCFVSICQIARVLGISYFYLLFDDPEMYR